MKTFTSILLALALLLSTPFAIAGAGEDTPRHNAELRREIRAYAKQNIIPVLREKRIAFEKQLSAEDKKEIARLRARQQELRQQAKSLRERFKASRNGTRTPLTPEEKAALNHLRAQQQQLLKRTGTIAERYRPELEAIQTDLAVEKAAWAADIRGIYAKYKTTAQSDSTGNRKQFSGSPTHALRALKLLRPMQFILWDAGGSLEDAQELRVFPNPTTGVSQIRYHIVDQGHVNITLLDAKGNKVRTLLDEQKVKGPHELRTDLSTLKDGLYYIKIEKPGGVETKRILKR